MHRKKKRKFSFIVLIIIIVGSIMGSIVLIKLAKSRIDPSTFLESEFVQKQIVKSIGEENTELFDFVPRLLGFDSPKTYLVLLLNNTELRPGGGFIGIYATLEVNQGRVEVLSMEGTGLIDKRTPDSWQPVPPKPISDHLGVDRWYFRDSNWSPDYVESARRALEFYRAEGGVVADKVDAVIAITPRVIEELMRITGPIVADGIKFTADNVTEKLQYEVEYGYDDRGLTFDERKKIVRPLMLALFSKIKSNIVFNISKYIDTLIALAGERHIMAYSLDPTLQGHLDDKEWSGKLKHIDNSDYIMWVDANLAALKTDYAMQRSLSYQVEGVDRTAGGWAEWVSRAKMRYTHNGSFDWRTTRYRTYARVYTPFGSELKEVSIYEADGSKTQVNIEEVDQGEELDKTWFGYFFVIEPGKTRELEFVYKLPYSFSELMKEGMYTLFVQKQLGTNNHGLTLGLNFDRNILSATPAEEESDWGNEVYSYSTDLQVDREFSCIFSTEYNN